MEYFQSYPEVTEMEAEIATLGFDHSQLGRQLAINWKLPTRLADAIGFHHQPQTPNLSEDFSILINFADYVSYIGLPAEVGPKKVREMNQATIDFFGVEQSDIEELKTALFNEYMKAETFMRIAGVS